jgi:hypothetical protein
MVLLQPYAQVNLFIEWVSIPVCISLDLSSIKMDALAGLWSAPEDVVTQHAMTTLQPCSSKQMLPSMLAYESHAHACTLTTLCTHICTCSRRTNHLCLRSGFQ